MINMTERRITASYQFNEHEDNVTIEYRQDDMLVYIYLTLEEAEKLKIQLDKAVKNLKIWEE